MTAAVATAAETILRCFGTTDSPSLLKFVSGNRQPATARLPNELKETTNGVRIEGSRAATETRSSRYWWSG